MSSIVRKFAQNGDIIQTASVKNLGWLLAHKHEVTAIYLHGAYGGSVKLHAYLTVNGVAMSYTSTFADYTVMCDFVSKRRAWKNVSTSRV